MKRKVKASLLSERISGQVTSFVDALRNYNSTFPSQRQHRPEDYKFLKIFFSDFINDRNHRADEVNSPEYKKVLEIANSLLPMTPLGVMCMDGRVKLIHVFGFSAGIGSSIRAPGGLLKEFVRGREGRLTLADDSNFAELLDEALRRNDALVEIFDSHWGCAARKNEETARGGQPEDAGLYSDIVHKKEMVSAAKAHILEEKESFGKHQIIFAQTTFNPLTGFSYMGLETDKALRRAKDFVKNKARKNGINPESAVPVYSKEVMGSLVGDGLIISTGQLIGNDIIKEKLDQNFFNISWKRDYIKTATQFWKGVSNIKDDLLAIFKQSLKSIYPELSHEDKRTKKELEEKAMLLLCNTYNGYLHNKSHVEMEYLSIPDEEYESKGHYEYDHHSEEGIKVSEGGYPPYEIPMFVIFSGDLQNVPSGIEMASGIVRENRAKERIKDSSGTYSNSEEFATAPVPVVMQEIVRDTRLTEQDWKVLEETNWSDLPVDWDTIAQVKFAVYLQKKGKFSIALANAVENLRNKMRAVFDPNAPTAAHLIDQYKVVLPLICDQDRKTHAIIPFVKLGY